MDPTNWEPPILPMPVGPRRRAPWPSIFAPVFSTQAYPTPDLLATQTVQPCYPDRVSRARWPRAQYEVTSGALLPAAALGLSWLPSYPGQYTRTRFSAQPLAFSPPTAGGALVVAAALAWMPQTPWPAPARRSLPHSRIWAVDPTIPAAGVHCLAWRDRTGTTTRLTLEIVTQTTVTQAGVTVTELTQEDLC